MSKSVAPNPDEVLRSQYRPRQLLGRSPRWYRYPQHRRAEATQTELALALALAALLSTAWAA